MNDILWDLIVEGIVIVYLDNILIFTRTVEEYVRVVCWVLEMLAEHKLFLYPKKCKFQKKQIEYLGLVISENKVSMDPIKVARVYKWSTLENKTDIQAFLRFVNFYRWFIQDFSALVCPLFDLTQADQVWTWANKKQKAFDIFKLVVTSALVLVLPQDLNSFKIKVDSSNFATRVVLSQ